MWSWAQIGFDLNQAADAFEVNEHQEIKRTGAVENWKGYYITRRNHLIVMMKGEGRLLDNLPKFYILYPPHIDDNQVVTGTTGMMFKIGSGGGVFSAKVLLRRDSEAFTKCDVLPNRKFDVDIMGEI